MRLLLEYRDLLLIIITIFLLTLLGAYFSTSFEERHSYLELFFLLGSLLFIFSALVVAVTLGSASFGLYGAIFLAGVMGIYGIEGAALVVLLTYLVWGFTFTMELLLLYQGVKSAKEWFQIRYTLESFSLEYRLFYPLIPIALLFLEWIPSLLYREPFLRIETAHILPLAKRLLKES